MKIAVVILNWNGRKLLEQFLPSVLKYSSEANIYVADNASTDDSVKYVKQAFPSVGIIQNKENGGYAKGYNEALNHLEEEVFVLLNSDVEVTENWLLPMVEHFESHPETAVIQPKIRDYKRKNYFEYAGAAGGYIDRYAYPFCRGRLFDTLEEDTGQYDEECPIFWASGACLVIRSAVYNTLGGLDETYFAHQEEIDLCWRAYNAGYQAVYIPDSVVYHLGGATLNAMSPKKTFLNFRNSLFNILKNVAGSRVYSILFLRLCLDGIAGIKYLFEAKPSHTLAIIRAHFSFYKNFSQIKSKRKLQQHQPGYDKIKSILWVYFIRGKKKYQEISALKNDVR